MSRLPARQRPSSVIEVEFRRVRRPVGELTLAELDAVRISGESDIRPAAEFLRDLAAAKGLRVACAHDLTDKRTPVDAAGNVLARDVFGWEADEEVWWRNSRIALQSPITMACRFETEPFWVNAEGFHAHAVNHYLDAIDLVDFEARALTSAAIVVPVHMAFGQIGVVCLTPQDQSRTDLSDIFAAHGDMLAIYSRLFVTTYVKLMGGAQALPAGALLSKREVECLRWAALGKTDLEIGMIISRSRATVRFHIHNASLKLNAVNRCQTLFKASQLGYITLG
ncbi:helix-turn-helix domain-containing protein [Novosphingobium sp. PP1Y]|uniref:helix-turn-helix transcriptional regulator n=1 Tax=Novosphingobium sp. PP1Y TaxID=702113 RepID=UPI00020EFAF5|nr:helix-turn-helix domain-containing protein [Novosphingobium sp. PP1Y]CCA90574.1 regulatory protein, LuxR [Novosphingobium sp. PP1Y]